MSPEDIIANKFRDVKLLHLGNISNNDELLGFYAAKVKSNNGISFNLLMATIPRKLFKGKEYQLSDDKWRSVYLRSYFSVNPLTSHFPFQWDKILDGEEQEITNDELDETDLWVSEIPEKTIRGSRVKYYIFNDPELKDKYVVSLESRSKNVEFGTGLRTEYEFDLLLGFNNNFNVSVEKFKNDNNS